MSPADIRVIHRLSTRVNVLPIVARADILTDEKLAAVKRAINYDLAQAKMGYGVFGPAKVPLPDDASRHPTLAEAEGDAEVESELPTGGMSASGAAGSQSQSDEGFGSEESSEDERQSRPLRAIKLNSTRRRSSEMTRRLDDEDSPSHSLDPGSHTSQQITSVSRRYQCRFS